MLVNSGGNLIPVGYTDSDFQTCKDSRKSTSGSIFILGGGAIVWRSIKQGCIVDSTMEAEYVAAKEAVWLRKFFVDLKVIPDAEKAMTLFCDNEAAIGNSKECRHHKRTKHIDRRYHLIRGLVANGVVNVYKVASEDNLAEPFTKTLAARAFERHVEGMEIRNRQHLLN